MNIEDLMGGGRPRHPLIAPFEADHLDEKKVAEEMQLQLLEMTENPTNDPYIDEENEIRSYRNVEKALLIKLEHIRKKLHRVRMKPVQQAKSRANQLQRICLAKATHLTDVRGGWTPYIVIQHENVGTPQMNTVAMVKIKRKTEDGKDWERRMTTHVRAECSPMDAPTRSGGRLAALRKLEASLDEQRERQRHG